MDVGDQDDDARNSVVLACIVDIFCPKRRETSPCFRVLYLSVFVLSLFIVWAYHIDIVTYPTAYISISAS